MVAALSSMSVHHCCTQPQPMGWAGCWEAVGAANSDHHWKDSLPSCWTASPRQRLSVSK